MKHFYAKYHWTVQASNPGYGFANDWACVAFKSKAERKAFLEYRQEFDFGAHAISRKEAAKMAETIFIGCRGIESRGIEIYSENCEAPEYVITYKGIWS